MDFMENFVMFLRLIENVKTNIIIFGWYGFALNCVCMNGISEGDYQIHVIHRRRKEQPIFQKGVFEHID